MTKRYLTCTCCGEDAGRYEQHWNQDNGFGICARCVVRVRKRYYDDAEIAQLYGKAGVNYEAPQAQGVES